MNREEIVKYLNNALQPDDQLRREAEVVVTNMQQENYPYFVQNMVEIFADPASPKQLKMISGIIMKNSLHTNDQKMQEFFDASWMSINEQIRENIKNLVISCFMTTDTQISVLAGAILGYIAKLEISQGTYLNFFMVMDHLCVDDRNAYGAFEALNAACETLLAETTFSFVGSSDIIYNACMCKIEDMAVQADIKEEALKCLLTCFEALDGAYSKEQNVVRFLHGIANCASIDMNLNNKALICLNRFVKVFYRYIGDKVVEVSNYFNSFWGSESEDVRIQVIEYWTIIAEKKEVDLENFLPGILPNMLTCVKKNEDTLADNWNAHKATAYFFETLTEIYGSKILFNPLIYKFIDAELSSNDRERIDTGAITLGCVIAKDCDHEIVNFVKRLVEGITDLSTIESCLYALAKICEVGFLAVVEHLSVLIKQICAIIEQGDSTATNAAWIVSSIYMAMNKLKKPRMYSAKMPLESQVRLKEYAETQLSSLHPFIVHALVTAIEKANIENSAYRVSLFAALTEAIIYSEDSRYDILDECMVYCTRKMSEGAYLISKSSVNYVLVLEDVLSNYVALSETIIRIRKKDTADIVYPIYIEILKGRPSSAIGEVYIALTNNISEYISRLDNILPFITRDISCLDMFILKCAVNLIGCMANMMQSNFYEICNQVVPLLVQNLSSKNVYKDVKTQILSVFGDIALALGVNFEVYLEMTVAIFLQIVHLDRRADDKYVDDLRYNMLQTVNCVVLATCESQRLRDFMNQLVEGVKIVVTDKNNDKTLLSLISLVKDLRAIFCAQYDLDGHWVTVFYNKCLSSENAKVRDSAHEAIRKK